MHTQIRMKPKASIHWYACNWTHLHRTAHTRSKLDAAITQSWSPDVFALLAWCAKRKPDAGTPVITPSHGEEADGDSICAGDDNNDDRSRKIIMIVMNNSIFLMIHMVMLPIMMLMTVV